MNGFSVEPGERTRLRHVDLAGAARVEIVGRGDAREHLAGRVVDREDRDRDVGPERARALARELFEILLQRRVDGEAMQAAAGRGGDDRVGGVRRQHRHRLARRPAPARAWRARSRRRARRRRRRRGRARGRARCARPRSSGRAGAAPAIAAARPAAPPRRASAGAAPCRNRRARPRARLRDCRHRARG